ncbi:MAG: twin-arginine translocation pathway signal protein [Burkholderiaceae bacterium]
MSKVFVPNFDAPMPRRMFLQGSAALLGGAFLPDAVAAAKGCRPTEQDIIGPFYRFGAPFETKLAGPDEAGDRVIVAGTVYSSDCRSRVPNALIEVWQSNKAGLYDTDKPGNFTERNAFRLRGMMLTDQQGHYEFETIMPGRYAIPPGLPGLEKFAGMTRPAHIHFRVSESLHIPLTTQLYFKGDPFIAKDPFASRKPSLAIDLKSDGKHLRGIFDLVLAKGL